MRIWAGKETEAPARLFAAIVFAVLAARWEYFRAWAGLPAFFWQPEGLLSPLPPPSLAIQTVAMAVALVSLALLAAGRAYRASAIAAAVALTMVLGVKAGYGAENHSEPIVVLALWVVALAPPRAHWPSQLIFALWLLVFFSAGFSKLVNLGTGWMATDHFQRAILRAAIQDKDIFPFETVRQLTLLLATKPVLCLLAANLILLFELAAPLALVAPRIVRRVLLAAAFFFLVSEQLFIARPLFAFLASVMVFFVDWESPFRALRERGRRYVPRGRTR